MMHTILVDTQWGDTGKAKVEDILAKDYDVFVKCNGGPNSGRTVYLNGRKIVFRTLSAGLLRPNKICVIGNGALINPSVLKEEINMLKRIGVRVTSNNLRISGQAHLILDRHIKKDCKMEESREKPIGTTKNGIGPCMSDKASRSGMRVEDLFCGRCLNEEELEWRELFADFYCDNVPHLLQEYKSSGKNILVVVVHGSFLDIDHGTYPYVTSSNCIASQAWTGTGLPIDKDTNIIGIVKAYVSRVGEGPFMTEQTESVVGKLLQDKGNEFGSVTKRPRRVGWLDLVMLKHAVQINRIDELFLTKLDVLDWLKEIKVCTEYHINGVDNPKSNYIYNNDLKGECSRVYMCLPGWSKSISGVKSWEELPPEALSYLQVIEDYVGVPINYIGTGQDREEYIPNYEE